MKIYLLDPTLWMVVIWCFLNYKFLSKVNFKKIEVDENLLVFSPLFLLTCCMKTLAGSNQAVIWNEKIEDSCLMEFINKKFSSWTNLIVYNIKITLSYTESEVHCLLSVSMLASSEIQN